EHERKRRGNGAAGAELNLGKSAFHRSRTSHAMRLTTSQSPERTCGASRALPDTWSNWVLAECNVKVQDATWQEPTKVFVPLRAGSPLQRGFLERRQPDPGAAEFVADVEHPELPAHVEHEGI